MDGVTALTSFTALLSDALPLLRSARVCLETSICVGILRRLNQPMSLSGSPGADLVRGLSRLKCSSSNYPSVLPPFTRGALLIQESRHHVRSKIITPVSGSAGGHRSEPRTVVAAT